MTAHRSCSDNRGVSTVLLVMLLAGLGVTGLSLVTWLASQIGDQVLSDEPDLETLEYAPPQFCVGARVVARFSPGTVRILTRPLSGNPDVSVTVKQLDSPLFEESHSADFNRDGSIAGAHTTAAVTGVNPDSRNLLSGTADGVEVFDVEPVGESTRGYVAVHRGRGCWTSGVCVTTRQNSLRFCELRVSSPVS